MSDTKRADTIAKEMFFAGLLGLPWLWIVNILYFWDTVYGRLPCLGGDGNNNNNTNNNSNNTLSNSEEATGILGMMESRDENDEEESMDEDGPSQEEIRAEVAKWVKRSSLGSILAIVGIVTWNIVFQLNRDSFGPAWFVMSEDEADRTGW